MMDLSNATTAELLNELVNRNKLIEYKHTTSIPRNVLESMGGVDDVKLNNIRAIADDIAKQSTKHITSWQARDYEIDGVKVQSSLFVSVSPAYLHTLPVVEHVAYTNPRDYYSEYDSIEGNDSVDVNVKTYINV